MKYGIIIMLCLIFCSCAETKYVSSSLSLATTPNDIPVYFSLKPDRSYEEVAYVSIYSSLDNEEKLMEKFKKAVKAKGGDAAVNVCLLNLSGSLEINGVAVKLK